MLILAKSDTKMTYGMIQQKQWYDQRSIDNNPLRNPAPSSSTLDSHLEQDKEPNIVS